MDFAFVHRRKLHRSPKCGQHAEDGHHKNPPLHRQALESLNQPSRPEHSRVFTAVHTGDNRDGGPIDRAGKDGERKLDRRSAGVVLGNPPLGDICHQALPEPEAWIRVGVWSDPPSPPLRALSILGTARMSAWPWGWVVRWRTSSAVPFGTLGPW